jgi:hypothetical protein
MKITALPKVIWTPNIDRDPVLDVEEPERYVVEIQ